MRLDSSFHKLNNDNTCTDTDSIKCIRFNSLVKETGITEKESILMLEDIDTLLELMDHDTMDSSHAAMYQDMVDKKKEKFVLSVHDKPIQEQHDRKKNGKVYIIYATRAKGETSYTKASSYDRLIEKLYEKYSKTGDKFSLESVFARTIEDRAGDIDISITGKTLLEYQNLWDKYYKDYPIAKMNVKKLGAAVLAEHFTTIIREFGLTKTKAKNIRIVINMVANYCLKTGIIKHSFASDLVFNALPFKKEPAYNSIKANSFSKNNSDAIIAWAKNQVKTNKKIVPTYMWALVIGMRLGLRYAELHALKWSDVDLDSKCLFVRKQRTINYSYENGKFICNGRKDKDTLKGQEEMRMLPITPDVEEALSEVRALGLSDEYVFPDGHFRYHTYNDKVKEAAKAVNLNPKEYRSHSARTTAATNLYNECKDIYVVQSLLGHTNPQMTMKYIKNTDKFNKLKESMFRTISDQNR